MGAYLVESTSPARPDDALKCPVCRACERRTGKEELRPQD
jgi:hypothetical protein